MIHRGTITWYINCIRPRLLTMQDITTRNKQTKVQVETVRYMVAQFHDVINCIRTRLLTIQDMRTLNKQTSKQTNKGPG